MTSDLYDILNIYSPVGTDSVAQFASACSLITYQKGETIVGQGERATNIYFVRHGIFRVSCVIDGVEDTICFGHDGDGFMSFHAFYAREVSLFACVAVTKIDVFRISFADFSDLMERNPEIMRLFSQMLVEELYLLERRYRYFSANDAYSRFVTFVAVRPDILQLVPAKYIAQYLKIRPETLYRIRARYLREGGNTPPGSTL